MSRLLIAAAVAALFSSLPVGAQADFLSFVGRPALDLSLAAAQPLLNSVGRSGAGSR